jgi:hypothetical protein
MIPRASTVLLVLLGLAPTSLQGQRTEAVYRSPKDTSGNAYRIYLPSGPPQSLLILLPGYGSGIDSYASSGYTPSALPKLLAERGVATIVAVPAAGTLYADDRALGTLDEMVAEVLRKHRIPNDHVAIGGFSAGGTGAVRYAQRCARRACRAMPGLVAVFAVDAPLDFERLHHGEQLALQRAAPRSNLDESRMVIETLGRELGGPPDKVPAAYRRSSPVTASAADGGNAGTLASTPLRLYSEPDIAWWIEQRNVDYSSLNTLDHAAMVNLLRAKGNARAELILTTGKGRRPDGTRHPHSWSIVDEADLARWLLAALTGK